MRDKPKTAYEVRRYLTLVQVLALNNKIALVHLGKQWELVPDDMHHTDVDPFELVVKLARHVDWYHKQDDSAVSEHKVP